VFRRDGIEFRSVVFYSQSRFEKIIGIALSSATDNRDLLRSDVCDIGAMEFWWTRSSYAIAECG
jgi:hypothetical protein